MLRCHWEITVRSPNINLRWKHENTILGQEKGLKHPDLMLVPVENHNNHTNQRNSHLRIGVARVREKER